MSTNNTIHSVDDYKDIKAEDDESLAIMQIQEELDDKGNEIKSQVFNMNEQLRNLQSSLQQDSTINEPHIIPHSSSTEIKEEDKAPPRTISQRQERYDEISNRLEELVIMEENYEKNKVSNQKSSVQLQGKGWSKGFFLSSPSSKKKKNNILNHKTNAQGNAAVTHVDDDTCSSSSNSKEQRDTVTTSTSNSLSSSSSNLNSSIEKEEIISPTSITDTSNTRENGGISSSSSSNPATSPVKKKSVGFADMDVIHPIPARNSKVGLSWNTKKSLGTQTLISKAAATAEAVVKEEGGGYGVHSNKNKTNIISSIQQQQQQQWSGGKNHQVAISTTNKTQQYDFDMEMKKKKVSRFKQEREAHRK